MADTLRRFAPAYLETHAVTDYQRRALEQIQQCRTRGLGGQLWRCNDCEKKHYRYHSCRHRQCPTCCGARRCDWLDRMLADQLPIRYSHVVFTLPHDLLPVVALNPRVCYKLLFDASWEAMSQAALERHDLKIGVTAALHTWGQRSLLHVHTHSVLPLGGLTRDGSQWIDVPNPHDLIGGADLAERFRDRYVAGLRRLFAEGALALPASISSAEDPLAALEAFLAPAAAKDWVVNIQTPPEYCTGADAALKYLASYVTGSPMGNRRIVAVSDETVTFTWKDYRDGGAKKTETVSGEEFVRRFLLHILPPRFVRVRHRGFLASCVRKKRIAHIRELLGVPEEPLPTEEEPSYDPFDGDASDAPLKAPSCPHCGAAEMIWQAEVEPLVGWVGRRYGNYAGRVRRAGFGATVIRPP